MFILGFDFMCEFKGVGGLLNVYDKIIVYMFWIFFCKYSFFLFFFYKKFFGFV